MSLRWTRVAIRPLEPCPVAKSKSVWDSPWEAPGRLLERARRSRWRRRLALALLAAALVLVLVLGLRSRAFTGRAYRLNSPATTAMSYRLLQSFFETCAQLNVTAFVTEGSLLAIKRHGFLSPWDHDIEVRFTDHRSRKLFFAEGVPIINKQFGDRWQGLVDIDGSVGWGEAGGCSSNELLSRGEFSALFEKTWNNIIGRPRELFDWECKRKRARAWLSVII